MPIPTSFNSSSTSEEVASHYAGQIKGKVILITGATSGGLGSEAARVIAKYEPKLIILAGRSEENLNKTQDVIKAETPAARLSNLVIDLASLASVRRAAEEILTLPEDIDVLINNAGIMAGTYKRTEDGFESQFGTNHLGHYLFTNLIESKLLGAGRGGGGGRIVNVSSWGHGMSDILWEDVGFDEGKQFDQWKAYGQSKTANILFTVGIMNKWGEEGITSVALHPGVISTNLARSVPVPDLIASGILKDDGTPNEGFAHWKTLQQGAATHIVAAFELSLSEIAPVYLADCQIGSGVDEVQPYAVDKASADRLWKLSEKMVADK